MPLTSSQTASLINQQVGAFGQRDAYASSLSPGYGGGRGGGGGPSYNSYAGYDPFMSQPAGGVGAGGNFSPWQMPQSVQSFGGMRDPYMQFGGMGGAMSSLMGRNPMSIPFSNSQMRGAAGQYMGEQLGGAAVSAGAGAIGMGATVGMLAGGIGLGKLSAGLMQPGAGLASRAAGAAAGAGGGILNMGFGSVTSGAYGAAKGAALGRGMGMTAARGIGALAGGAAFMPQFAAGMALYQGVDYLTGNMAEGVRSERQAQDITRRYGNQMFGGAGIGGGAGGGATRSQMRQMGGLIRGMGAEDTQTSTDELMTVMEKMGQKDMFRMMGTSKNPEQFAKKFKDTLKTLKDVARATQTSLEEAVDIFDEITRMGFYRASDAAQFALNMQVSGNLTGMGMQGAGRLASRGAGAGGYATKAGGAKAALDIGTQLGTMEKLQYITPGDIEQVGGVEKFTALLQEAGSRALRTEESGGTGAAVMPAIAFMNKNGTVDRKAMNKFLNGGMSWSEVRDLATRKSVDFGRTFLAELGKNTKVFLDDVGGDLPLFLEKFSQGTGGQIAVGAGISKEAGVGKARATIYGPDMADTPAFRNIMDEFTPTNRQAVKTLQQQATVQVAKKAEMDRQEELYSIGGHLDKVLEKFATSIQNAAADIANAFQKKVVDPVTGALGGQTPVMSTQGMKTAFFAEQESYLAKMSLGGAGGDQVSRPSFGEGKYRVTDLSSYADIRRSAARLSAGDVSIREASFKGKESAFRGIFAANIGTEGMKDLMSDVEVGFGDVLTRALEARSGDAAGRETAAKITNTYQKTQFYKRVIETYNLEDLNRKESEGGLNLSLDSSDIDRLNEFKQELADQLGTNLPNLPHALRRATGGEPIEATVLRLMGKENRGELGINASEQAAGMRAAVDTSGLNAVGDVQEDLEDILGDKAVKGSKLSNVLYGDQQKTIAKLMAGAYKQAIGIGKSKGGRFTDPKGKAGVRAKLSALRSATKKELIKLVGHEAAAPLLSVITDSFSLDKVAGWGARNYGNLRASFEKLAGVGGEGYGSLAQLNIGSIQAGLEKIIPDVSEETRGDVSEFYAGVKDVLGGRGLEQFRKVAGAGGKLSAGELEELSGEGGMIADVSIVTKVYRELMKEKPDLSGILAMIESSGLPEAKKAELKKVVTKILAEGSAGGVGVTRKGAKGKASEEALFVSTVGGLYGLTGDEIKVGPGGGISGGVAGSGVQARPSKAEALDAAGRIKAKFENAEFTGTVEFKGQGTPGAVVLPPVNPGEVR
ncbi:hypothetical protein LCGC14_0144850 [marine sediment metagenome]|uniref:Uncharacterized protein n=1 Tax=marine sediment metagenome TaxID=412755 RepID=A0A0F9Y178_9ZZZZ